MVSEDDEWKCANCEIVEGTRRVFSFIKNEKSFDIIIVRDTDSLIVTRELFD